MAGTQNAILNLTAVIGFPVVVLLYDNYRNRLNLLVSGKPLSTGVTETSSADGTIVIRRPGIDYPRIFLTAKWAFHNTTSAFLPSVHSTAYKWQYAGVNGSIVQIPLSCQMLLPAFLLHKINKKRLQTAAVNFLWENGNDLL